MVGFRSERHFSMEELRNWKPVTNPDHRSNGSKVDYLKQSLFDFRHCIKCDQDLPLNAFEQYETTCDACYQAHYKEVYGDEYLPPKRRRKTRRKSKLANGIGPTDRDEVQPDKPGTHTRKPGRPKGSTKNRSQSFKAKLRATASLLEGDGKEPNERGSGFFERGSRERPKRDPMIHHSGPYIL